MVKTLYGKCFCGEYDLPDTRDTVHGMVVLPPHSIEQCPDPERCELSAQVISTGMVESLHFFDHCEIPHLKAATA